MALMERRKPVEKHAARMGQDIRTTWLTFTSGGAATEAPISGNVDLARSSVANPALLKQAPGGWKDLFSRTCTAGPEADPVDGVRPASRGARRPVYDRSWTGSTMSRVRVT